MVSIGLKKDQLWAKIIQPEFFASSATGLTVDEGYRISQILPRMFELSEISAQTAVEAVNAGM